MSPRPRKVTDEQLFQAAQATMSRVGPGELTLEVIAREAGVTAAVLVQRFGSKRALLLALFERASGESGRFIAELAQKHSSPLAALRAYADCMAGMAASPAALARSLAYLQIDLTDSEFRKHLAKQARTTRAGFERLLLAAIENEELKPSCDAGRLARTVEAILSGSMLTWAFYRQGSAAEWMRGDLDAVLAPYATKRRR